MIINILMKAFGIIISVVFVLIGLNGTINEVRKSNECTEEVVAIVQDVKTEIDGEGHIQFIYYIEYIFEGKECRRSVYQDEHIAGKGDEVKILINPDNPYEIYIEGEAAIFVFALGIGAMCLAWILFIPSGGSKENEEDYEKTESYKRQVAEWKNKKKMPTVEHKESTIRDRIGRI